MLPSMIENERCRLALNKAEAIWPRVIDAWEAATWILANDPLIGVAVTESGRTRSFTLQGARSIGKPDITLLYEVRNGEIEIQDANFKEAGPYVQQVH